MRTRVITVFLFLFAIFPAPAHAQGAMTLESLKVSLWSEYDQPSMLVIYDIKLSPDIPLPANLDVRIPVEGNITAVAYLAGDQLLNTEYAGPQQDSQWQTITLFIKQNATYRIEYYQPLTRKGDDRSFNYEWAGDYTVDHFSVEVKVPGDSTAIQSTPSLPFAPDSPFLTGTVSATPFKAGDTYQLQLSYRRPGDETVFAPSSPQVSASEPITQNTPGRVTLNNLPYILGIVGVVLIVGAIYYFRQTNPQPEIKSRKRTRKASDDAAQIYCHECGARAHEEDRFCRICGTKLRMG